jgi:hypothetical protein
MASSAYTLRYWSDTYDIQNFSYPYISIDNLDKNDIDKNESHIIRHEKCAINLIKSKELYEPSGQKSSLIDIISIIIRFK